MLALALSAIPAYAVRADRGTGSLPSIAPSTSARSGEKTSDQIAAEGEAVRSGLRIRWDDEQASPSRVRGAALARQPGLSTGGGVRPAPAGGDDEKALEALAGVGRLFDIQDVRQEFKSRLVFRDNLGHRHVRLQQMHRGLRVVGGELVVHLDSRGDAYEVNGRRVTRLASLGTARLSSDAAVKTASSDLAGIGIRGAGAAARPEPVVFAFGRDPVPAYELVMRGNGSSGPEVWRYWVDGVSGGILLRYRDIRTVAAPTANGAPATITGSMLAGEGGAVTNITGWRETSSQYFYLHSAQLWWQVFNSAGAGYTDSKTYAYRGSSDWGVSDRTEISMARSLESIQQYYWTMFGLRSFNGAGKMAIANVHYQKDLVNAYWNPSAQAFYFGDGDGETADSLAVLDIAAHEFGHAVAGYTADFVYANESGALDESFADISGACVEFFAQPDGRSAYPGKTAGHADWLLGEDSWLSSTALRDMRAPSDPATVGIGNEQPSRYKGSFWYGGAGDNGGVHYNSGVQNFFFYLLAEGGTGTNDGVAYAVSGIGITNAARIAYRTVTAYCTPSTGYRAVRDAWMSAAEDLDPLWVAVVDSAWNAAGLGSMGIEPATGLNVSGPVGGPFTPVARRYTVTNSGIASLSWTATHTQTWIRVTPAAGTLAAGRAAEVVVALESAASLLAQGLHADTIVFSNSASGGKVSLAVTVRAGTRDYITELFSARDNDLAGTMLTFTPDAATTSYTAMAEYVGEYPTDPSGGATLGLGDDSSVLVTLAGTNRVRLFGVAYDRFHVGSNGYITFGSGDSDISESLAEHFDLPRISALFDDLNPAVPGSTVSWKACPDRVAVTYDNVPEYMSTVPNRMQVEMFFNGTIRIAYPLLNVTDGLAGLSPGGGLPAGFVESDLSSYGRPPFLVVTPGSVDFGTLQVGSSREAVLAVTNSGECAMQGALTAAGAFSVVSGGPYYLAPGTTQTVRVRFAPLSAGTHTGRIQFPQGGGTSCILSGRAIGAGDQDGDGATDWEEYLAGTDSTNKTDRFGVGEARTDAGGIVISWNSVTGRWYTVCASTNLMGQWKDVHVAPGTGGEMSYTNPPSGASSDFLRVRVGPEP